MDLTIDLTIEDRIKRINETTEQVKAGFMVIASDMAAIASDPEYLKKDKDGKVKTNREGETMFDGPRFYAFMQERTGYTRRAVGMFLEAHTAMGNLIDYYEVCKNGTPVPILPDSESVIRPLATKKLNEDPELQAEIWTEVVAEAGDAEITAKMVKEKVKAKLNPEPEKPTTPPPAPTIPTTCSALAHTMSPFWLTRKAIHGGWRKRFVMCWP